MTFKTKNALNVLHMPVGRQQAASAFAFLLSMKSCPCSFCEDGVVAKDRPLSGIRRKMRGEVQHKLKGKHVTIQ
eukprot:1144437-Pelagomonas_calceolata.AAC.2